MEKHELFDRIAKEVSACLATNTEDINPENGDTFFGLPKPYSVPTPGDCFHEMYYWDTYFTNVGLIAIGNEEQAKNNVEDIASMIERFGFMPNGSRRRYLKHSQPPFFAEMVRELPHLDETSAKRFYEAMKTEHQFFSKNRTFPNGLAHYGFLATEEDTIQSRLGHWKRRTGIDPDPDPQVEVGNYLSYCESGWDCNPRWEKHGFQYAAIDLNSLLWNLEETLALFAAKFEPAKAAEWKKLADKRKEAMNAFLWNEKEGCFLDRNVETGAFSPVFSAASFYPLYFGLATPEQAKKTLQKLPLLEREWGIMPCQEVETEAHFQWGAPTGWPCIQWMLVGALEKYGFTDDARRVAEKYVALVEKVEAKTGQFWEKYDVITGEADAGAEYNTPPMLGWTAGVYLKCKLLLDGKKTV